MPAKSQVRSDFRVFTICARNYIAYARVLAESLNRADRSLRLAVLLLDDETGAVTSADQNFDIIRPADLPFSDAEEFHRMAVIYDVTELATAVKPWVFQHLFDTGAGAVIYLDPDIEVFGSLSELEAAAREHGLVLTPHTLKPLPRDGKIPGERELLLAGTYNLGFLGVGAHAAKKLLPWWSERLRRDCRNAVESGYFVDQRWMDFVPSYFDHFIVRDPGYNVAYWNLPTRTVSIEGHGYTVDGSPLRFFHFSGFSPDRSHLLSKHQGLSPRILLSDHPALARLCTGYAEKLVKHGFHRWSKVEYRFEKTANGVRLDPRMRRLYRDALLDQELNGNDAVLSDPFTVDGARDFLDWLRYPASPQTPDVSRYLFEIYKERGDLRAAFPELTSSDAIRYLDWIRSGGYVEPPIPAALMPSLDAVSSTTIEEVAPPAQLRHGINLYGYVFAESGTGQIGRSLVSAVKAAGIPYAVVPFTTTVNRQKNPFSDYGNGAPIYDTNLICVNADQVPVFVEQMGSRILQGRYNIGVWAWEVEEFPDSMARSASLLDEVWGISKFAAAAVARKVTDIPVRAFPLPVVAPEVVERTRAELGLPDGFLFFFCFDFESVFDRKNPLAVIDAFRRAFPQEGEASLYIKSVNGHRRVIDLERLRAAAAGRRDIILADGYRSAEDQTALMSACDVYVSLHRSEGFGLTLAEAMALGKPVIGTAYSSTAEFMTRSNSYLIPAEMVPIGDKNAPYPANGRWAAPDIEAAARFMRQTFENRQEAAARGEHARQDIRALHSAEARATLLSAYMSDIDQRRDSARFITEAPVQMPANVAPGTDVIQQLNRPPAVPPPAATRPDQRAESLIWGPNPDLPSRFPRIAGFFRRLMLRVIRNYWVHQREVDRALLEALRTSSEQARNEMTVMSERLSRKLAALEAHVKLRQTIDSAEHVQVERREEAFTQSSSADAAAVAKRLAALDQKLGRARVDFDDTASRTARQSGANARNLRQLQERLAEVESRAAAAEAIESKRLAELDQKLGRARVDFDDTASGTARQNQQLQERLAEVESRVAAAEITAQTGAGSLVDVANSFTEKLNRTMDSSSHLEETWQKIDLVEARLAGAINEIRDTVTRLSPRQSDVPLARLAALEDALAHLSAELHAVPYVVDPGLIRTTNVSGSEVIGYQSEAGKPVPEFEEVFRGSEDFIRERQRVYVPLLRDAAPVVDLGCGRGEMLDLLKQSGVGAVGVELSDRLAEYCRGKGLSVQVADATDYLSAQPDHSLGAVFSAQFIEHLDQSRLEEFFALARRKLRPGGILVAETVNPHSVPAMKCFWVDPTHKTPIFPETAVALCRAAGFAEAQIVFPNGTGTLKDDLFTQGEYAVVARELAVDDARESETKATRLRLAPRVIGAFAAKNAPIAE